MVVSNLDELCLFSVYHANLVCVAAFGVQGNLGLMRSMMLLSYESGVPKVGGRRYLLRISERNMYNIKEVKVA
jgi:hypothetical protein